MTVRDLINELIRFGELDGEVSITCPGIDGIEIFDVRSDKFNEGGVIIKTR